MLIFAVLFLSLYLSLTIFTKIKLRRKFFGIYLFDTLFCPLINFLKTIPYISKFGLMTKYYMFIFVISIFTPITAGFLDHPHLILSLSTQFLGFFLIPTVIFFILSFVYFRYQVSRDNPICHLLVLHPEGRNEIRKYRDELFV
jgi:hypothetical protein